MRSGTIARTPGHLSGNEQRGLVIRRPPRLQHAGAAGAEPRPQSASRTVRVLIVLLLAAAGCVHRPTQQTAGSLPVCREVRGLSDDSHRAPIAWFGPDDQRNRPRLNAWCATVGPVVYESRPRNHDARPIDRLVVISWNTHVGGGDVDALVDAVQRGDFSHGEPFDAIVLLLQEVYRHGDGVPESGWLRAAVPSRIADALHAAHARDVRRLASDRGLAMLYAPSMRNGALADDPEDRGNAILSTLTLSDPLAIELPIEHQRRVVTVAAIDGETTSGRRWRLRVASVHFDTALALFRGGPSAARERQASALISTLVDVSPFDGATVLGGDFNTLLGPVEPAVRHLRAAFPDAPLTDTRLTWSGPIGLSEKLDYVFANGLAGAIDVQRLPSRFGSDHYPLLSVIRF
jgi:endonuclease/exonuclease/phosphatase family metal-dependent hydrolase